MRALRAILIVSAAITSIPAGLWLAIVMHATFYDSLGNYHAPTLAHLLSNLVIGLAPFVVPAALAVGAFVVRPTPRSPKRERGMHAV